MNQTKRKLERFAFCDYAAIQEHLEDMATQGWMLDKPGNLIWRFHRIEPQKLRFAVTFFPNASDFDPGPTDGQQMLEEMSSRQGWILAARWGQMMIFYSTDENPVPIETDPVAQMETIHRAMKKSMLPSQLLLLALCVYQLVFMGWQLHSNPVEILSRPSSLYMLVAWGMLMCLTLLEIGSYYFWHHRAKVEAESGSFYLGSQNTLQAGVY